MENSTFLNSLWAITPEEFQRFASYDFSRLPDPVRLELGQDAATESASYKDAVAEFAKQFHEKIEIGDDGAGVLRIEGPIMPHPDIRDRYYFGACDSVRVASLIRSAADDDSVRSLALVINSPGGMVVGTPEVGDAIRHFNSTGKVSIAYADTLMASAAYWIGSQASRLVTTGSALVGSIGVIRPHVDSSTYYEKMGLKVQIFRGGRHKVPGAMGTSMSEEQAQFIQAGVDECHEQFKATVCAFRKIDDGDMQGQVFYGTDAKARGLVDEIVSGLDEVFSISSALVDNSFMGMSNIVDPTPAPSAEANGELDSAVARVSELESQLESAQGRIADLEKALDESGIDSVKAQLDEANARVEELEAFDASNEAEIADLKSELVSLQEEFDAKVEARAKDLAEELAEQKAASIAAQAGTEPLAVSGDSAGGVEESEFASMTSEQKWAHCAQIADADEKRAFYLKHLSH